MKKATIYILALLLTAALFTGCAENANPAQRSRMSPRTRTMPNRGDTAPTEQIVTPRIVPPNRDGVARDGIVRDGDVSDGVVRDGIRRDGAVQNGVAQNKVRTHPEGFMVEGVHSRTLTR